MSDQIFPESGLPIRRTVDLLPQVFKTDANNKFMAAVVDPLVQPGVLEKTVGYVGRRYGKTYKGTDVYLDSDNTLRSRYQLEPGVILKNQDTIENFYDYLDFKNQLKFFNNNLERDDLITSQDHYSWNPPIEWDLFVNFREYYWVPSGPPSVKVLGQGDAIVSTYRVRQGTTSSWLITPDGLTNNPTLTLYRGQTYKFEVKSPREGFYIRTAFDLGSLKYIPYLTYVKNQLAVYDGQLWRAKTTVLPSLDGVIEEGLNWELVTDSVQTSRFDYSNGVTNNGTTNGTVTFEVPLDAPDVLFYQSDINPDRYGRIVVADIEDNTRINVTDEIVGKQTYTSSNGVEFVNGLMVRFAGKVSPAMYSEDIWLVENVGREIKLIKFSDLEVPIITTKIPEVIFDNAGFDSEPFDDATAYPGEKDYITICRASIDSNPWSRYNRWFHKSTLELAHRLNGTDFEAGDDARAKRPIIEFRPNIQLFNHGSIAKKPVDFIDTFTDDVFSKIEGSAGYSVDGEFLFQGARILVTADTDILANNKIYLVNFITHNGVKQITLRNVDDGESAIGECVLVKRGNLNKGLMYHFTGTNWVVSQEKTTANQPPLFDLFDKNGISFSDNDTYPVSTFAGSKILSYKVGSSTADAELGFSLSHLNIDNVGDILFNFDFDKDSFTYGSTQASTSVNLNTGFYRTNPYDVFENGWIKTDPTYVQPILDSVIVEEVTNQVRFNTVDWTAFETLATTKVLFYKNGLIHTDAYSRDKNLFTFAKNFAVGDTISIKIFAAIDPDQGYYQIPAGLEKNPLNQELTQFTLGQAIDHISTALEVDDRFAGSYPGNSNLRNIDGYQNRGIRFLKHSGIAPMAISLLCNKDINIIKSIQYSAKHYTEFKNEFISTAESLVYQGDPVQFVDDVITAMGRAKTSEDPFADSDMIGAGAHTDITYLVEDEGIKVFALSEKFDLTTLSRKAIYVYKNGVQLVHGRDYTFDSTFGFVRISATFAEGDTINIREYVSTGFNFIPATPTKLGLYKKYLPQKFLDDTYVTPRYVIQGHDGSLTSTYEDYKDDVLLELELRIYNNIKQEYREDIFNIDNILGGYYGNALYDKQQLDSIVNQEFLKWVSNTDIDYTDNSKFFDRQNSFTYTYSSMADPTGTQNLPGYWRGVYKWFYDTDRPHRCPWEMLGFSEQPDWWETEYGAAPYTSGNLLLWEDMRDGIIRQGPRAGTYDRYKRSSILSHIPVDPDGKLLSPLDSGLASNFTLINDSGSFTLGDISPAEYAWRSSSEWPYATIIAMCLMKPFEFITDSFDRSRISVNDLGQTVANATGVFFKLSDLVVPSIGGTQVSGLITFVSSYIISKNKNPQVLLTQLDNLDVRLSTRLSGFVDQTEQKYLLDSKNPNSSSSNIFVPPENYDIIFNVGVPINALSYSGILIEKLDIGWKVRGYDPQQPYFNYYAAVRSNNDPMMTVGGTSEKFTTWVADKLYGNGDLVKYGDRIYRSIKTHTSAATFEANNWKFMPKLPVVGGVEAAFRRNFDRLQVRQLVYGTVFTTVQGVVDFLLGYEAYLIAQGFSFDRYDAETQTAYNFQTSCKEFLFWTKHNWAVGSLLTLSPAADEISATIPAGGVAENLFDSFYDYQIFKSDGTPLRSQFLNVSRDFQSVKVNTVNTNDGIYFLRMYFVLKEHITVFDDRTVFNDVIYDKTTGYRQERIKARGFRTVDWDGDYTSPGFLFDNVNIQEWSPFTDYRLGDIVSYKSFNWTSQSNQIGAETFDESIWSKLDTTPTKGLVANFDYRINQFSDYYDVDADGLGTSQRDLSRHVIGYQTREYLQNLAEDNVTQFKLYQGFIREKGTANSITKVFDKLSRTATGSVELHEEWAFRVGRLGGTDQFTETEFRLHKADLKTNPQPILIAPAASTTDILDLFLRVPQSNFTIPLLPFSKDLNPTRKYSLSPRTAGYVSTSHVDFTVSSRDGILALDISQFSTNSHVWVTFEKTSWTVLRYKLLPLVQVTAIAKNTTRVLITFNRAHGLAVDDIFGIPNVTNLTGFFKVTETPTATSLAIQVDKTAPDPDFNPEIIVNIAVFDLARFENYQEADPESVALLTTGARMWIDKNADSNWEVVEKQTQFFSNSIYEYGVVQPRGNGSAVLYIDNLTQTISSTPKSNVVISYIERTNGLAPFQILQPPANLTTAANGVFGETLAVSPDGRWLVVGSPNASGVHSDYKEVFNPAASYSQGDMVVYDGKLWRATENIAGDGSTINVYSDLWEPATIITANDAGTNAGYTKQGVITLYQWSGQNWVEAYSFVSPRQEDGELYGSQIKLGVSNGDYYMAVSAPGSLDSLGRVYLYKYAALTADPGETITYNVTVGPSQGADNGSWYFYLNEQYKPNLTFLVGNTYVFDQSDLSNIFYPNPEEGTITNVHPLSFSSDDINGTLGDGTVYTVGVKYLLDNLEVTQAQYIARFSLATTRKVQIKVSQTTESVIYYFSTTTTGMGASVVRRYPNIAKEWKHLDDQNYKGVYDKSGATFYPVGSVIWAENSLWESLVDQRGDGSSVSTDASLWKQIDPIATQNSLPSNIAIADGSTLHNDDTLSEGMIGTGQLAEFVKTGDKFGTSMAMNYDGSVLVVGAPDSDSQYYVNYRGVWNSYQEYREDDVVKYNSSYYKLAVDGADSTYTSTNDEPGVSSIWTVVGTIDNTPSGKIFIYKRNSYGVYDLVQTVNSGSLPNISDLTPDEIINSGDKFGFALDIDSSGTVIVASSPQADANLDHPGSVFVLKSETDSSVTQYRIKEKLQRYEPQINELFGFSVSISPNSDRIVVGAANPPFKLTTSFDTQTGSGTTFDGVTFSYDQGYTGQVYVFELKDQSYFLAEKLEDSLVENEGFGFAIDATSSVIVTGSPNYSINSESVGQTRIFRKDPTTSSWETIAVEEPLVDIDLLKSISLYDDINNVKVADIDIVDNNKLKIVGIAEQEIKFKTPYDPATYTNGTDAVSVDEDQAWFEKNVGALWWNVSNAKWVYYEQGDIAYRVGHWDQLAVGASIDVYEWVESSVTPADWIKFADTADGLANNISGQPLYGKDVYSVKVFTNSATGQPYGTKYYFWVKGKTTVPQGVVGRKISAAEVATLIENPAASGTPLIAIIEKDKFLAYNFADIVTEDSILLNIEYYSSTRVPNAVHNEYQLLTEGVADNLPTASLENKWLDSLVGFNNAGNPVPDPTLPPKQRYGLAFRPIQTMFIDRGTALKIVIDNINSILATKPFTDLADFKYLNEKDPIPNSVLNLYDVAVDTVVDLSQVGTVRLKTAVLSINIVDGKVDTINIVEPGFGYKTVPPITITGDGVGAKAEATLDNQGRIISVKVTSKGRKYTEASISLRSFSVLVRTDSTLDNFWTIYSWDQDRSTFFKNKTQAYDTTKYWNYVDWYATGYGVTTRVVKELQNLYLESTISVDLGDIIRIKEFANGGWALLQRVEDGSGELLTKYDLVGREGGTIQLSSSLYNVRVYDAASTYDQLVYDNQPTKELRLVLKAVKENIFIDDLNAEWNKLFFTSMRYVFSEQQYVDWAFKTSFLNAIHNVGSLEQKTSFKSDNLSSFQNYLEEVKPYRTTIREYTSRYTKVDHQGAATTDFDLPPVYSTVDGKIIPISENAAILNSYPWKSWVDNKGYTITSIELAYVGADYVAPPRVVITGDGTGATAQAFVSNGKVSGIRMLTPGQGYTTASVALVGGNGTSQSIAKAVAILGQGNVRSFNVGVKFDRVSKDGTYTVLTQDQQFTADGFTAVFNLNYTPTRDKTKISVLVNSEIILDSDYSITFYKTNADGYTLLRAKLILATLPIAGDVIEISYEKDDSILDAVDRINKLYAPTSGMIGKEVSQLMTGIDFGGVQIQGTTFDVSGGWDALPWFTDNWDSVESSADYYYVADGSTNYVFLPTIPADNQRLSIYLKRKSPGSILDIIHTRDSALEHLINDLQYVKQDPEIKTIRIDDPNFGLGDGSTVTNPTALMPTFVGDGSTQFVLIGDYFRTEAGDTLIFRPIESDGTVTITDVNIIDTKLSGGTLAAMESAYSTATGLLAEDIVVDGSKFISPDQVPAPEENIPGQVLDSVSIKVFHTVQSGTAPLQSKVSVADGVTKKYDIGLTILEANSVIVYVDKVRYNIDDTNVDSTIVYSIDYIDNKVVFQNAPSKGSVIEIISIGLGGISLLDYQEFEADGDTLLFLTKANYVDTQSVVATVDGIESSVEFINSTGIVDTPERALIQFAIKPARRQVVKIVCLGTALEADSSGQSLVRVNKQDIIYDGTSISFDLDKFVNLSRASSTGAMVVEINGKQLNGVDSVVDVYNGTNNVLYIGQDPIRATNTATSGNIKVFVNNQPLRFILDYVYDGNENKITVATSVLTVGDEIKIEVDANSEYVVENNNLILTNFLLEDSSVDLQAGDVISVTWFSEYPSMNVVSDQYTGGKSQYQLAREPISASYIWVYRNGERLIQDVDYEVSLPRNVVYMKDSASITDEIKIVQYGNEIRRAPLAYEIFKDMLNVYHFKRFSFDKKVTLSQDLAYYDQEILVTDTSNLFEPIKNRNIPGTVYINGERIDYFEKTATSLKQLRRGSLGTAIAEVHVAGSEVVDLSRSETIPYTENQERADFVSDGSSTMIGPLDYIPAAATRANWTRTSIPAMFDPCDQIEVFVGGRRLRKDPIDVWDQSIDMASPAGDTTLEAEFSVDGVNPYIRLTTAVSAGTRITVLRRVGSTWYDQGATTASAGQTLTKNQSPVLTFLTQKASELPE